MIVADTLSRRPEHLSVSLSTIVSRTSSFLDKIREAYPNDDDFGSLYNTATNNIDLLPDKYTFIDGLLLLENRICVPRVSSLRHQLLSENHDITIQGHFGFPSTYNRIASTFYWPTLHADCKRFCQTCDICQRNKTPTQKPAGLLQPLSIPSERLSSVTMNFIVSLPRTSESYDSIFVVVDRLSKMAHLIPTRSTATAAEIAHLFSYTSFASMVFLLKSSPTVIANSPASSGVNYSNYYRRRFDSLPLIISKPTDRRNEPSA